MIVGIGCDVVDHNITKTLKWASRPLRIQRFFSAKELELSKSNDAERFLSGRFAAKEAILKCLGTGMRDGISLTDIQILQDNVGKPNIHIQGEVKFIADRLGISSWHLSITHTSNNSTAFVIAESLK